MDLLARPYRWAVLPEWGTPDWHDTRDTWCTWLTRHGLDPMRVECGSYVLASDDLRCVAVSRWLTDAALTGRASRRDCFVSRTVQLEAPALPFPTHTETPR